MSGDCGQSEWTAEPRIPAKVQRIREEAGYKAAWGWGQSGQPPVSVGLPGKDDTVRGFSPASLVLIDEAARVSEAMYDALSPTRAASDGDLWLMSTPYGSQGFFWRTWKDGGAAWERISAPATECGRIKAEFLAGNGRGESGVDNGEGLFSRESVEGAMGDEYPLEV